MPRARHRGAKAVLKAVPSQQQRTNTADLVREYHVKVGAAKKVVGDARIEVIGIMRELEDRHHLHRAAFTEAHKRKRQYDQNPAAALEQIERTFEYYIALGLVNENSNLAFNQGNLLKEAVA